VFQKVLVCYFTRYKLYVMSPYLFWAVEFRATAIVPWNKWKIISCEISYKYQVQNENCLRGDANRIKVKRGIILRHENVTGCNGVPVKLHTWRSDWVTGTVPKVGAVLSDSASELAVRMTWPSRRRAYGACLCGFVASAAMNLALFHQSPGWLTPNSPPS